MAIDLFAETDSVILEMTAFLHFKQTRVSVNRSSLIESCDLFAKNPILVETDYCVHSSVSEAVFLDFVSTIENGAIEVTAANRARLLALSTEFGFKRLLSEFDFGRVGSEWELKSRLCSLEERSALREKEFLSLRSEVGRLSALVERLSGLDDRLGVTERSVSSLGSEVQDLSGSVEKLSTLEKGLGECVDRLAVAEKALSLLQIHGRAKHFAFSQEAPLNGIIAHLTRMCGGNVHKKDVVRILNAKAIRGLSAVADLETPDTYVSLAGAGQWIGYDFIGKTVIVSEYTLGSRTRDWLGEMDSWIIEGSMDSENWVEMSRVVNCSDLNQPSIVRTFRIEQPVECRIWRLRQDPFSHHNSNIILSAIELFGCLIG
jgi:hypothetical protein